MYLRILCVFACVCKRVSDCFLSMIDVTYVLNTSILYRQHTYGMYLSVAIRPFRSFYHCVRRLCESMVFVFAIALNFGFCNLYWHESSAERVISFFLLFSFFRQTSRFKSLFTQQILLVFFSLWVDKSYRSQFNELLIDHITCKKSYF